MIELYHHGSSVCAAKVRFVLMEKDLEWQGHYLDILKGEHFTPDYLKLNPMAVVPTLVHDGEVLVESTVICEYLDDAFPERPLKPSSPLDRARMRLWTKAVDEHIQPACKYITYAACHRHIIGRLPPDKFDQYMNGPEAGARDARRRRSQLGRQQACHRQHGTGGAGRRFQVPHVRRVFAENGRRACSDTRGSRATPSRSRTFP